MLKEILMFSFIETLEDEMKNRQKKRKMKIRRIEQRMEKSQKRA